MPALGHKAYLGVKKETTWGIKDVAAMDYVELMSQSIGPTFDELIVQGINTSRARTKRVQGAKTVAGQVAFEVNAEDVIGDLLLGILPTEVVVDNGVSNGGKHTFTPGLTIPPGLTVQTGLDIEVRDNFGGRISKCSFEANAGELLKSTWDLTFKNEETGTPQVPSFTTENPLVYHAGVIKIDGAAAIIRSFKFDIDAGLKADRRALGSNLIQQQQPGMYDVSGQIDMFFDNMTLVNKFITSTTAALDLQFDGTVIGGGFSRYLQFVGPTVFLNGEMAKVSGADDEILLSLPFRAIKVAADDLFRVVLQNSKRTAY